ncbi:TadE-like protein [Alkalibaculum bacchi]|uniref:TadE-like protein n=1 Tax=Alkalibaculum bacchi TaxID=645887 RepID=A0A366I966_9FIRM|nr:TadE/TadG family type IV pilus assembly protein [Alkalibaculum bacchi]RBP66000.1 TadE-like protein [Alkalibaculum bacchi]
MSRLLKLGKSDKGQALVEFALVLPILLALILGMIEFGWILNGKITLTNAAREGARVAAIYHDKGAVVDDAKEAVINASVASSLTIIGVNTTFSSDTTTVIAEAEIEPIVGLFFNNKEEVSLTAQAVMRLE